MATSRRIAWTLTGIFALIAVAGMLCAPVFAAEKEAKIGVVDIQRVLKDAPRVKQYDETLNGLGQSLDLKLNIRSQNMMLSEDEIKELIDTKLKENQTDKDKARVKELEDAERARDAEYKQLQESKDLNEQQKTRLKELQGLQAKSKSTGEALEKDYKGQLQTKMQELYAKVDVDVREAINKVAEAKGYSMVLSKEMVFVGGTDVTDDVIAKLDRKVQ